MKKNIISIVKEPMYKYRILLLTVILMAFCTACLQSQNVTKKYEREVGITENTVININAPKSVRITGNGQINTRQVTDKYIVSTKESTPHVFVIDKRMVIHTWEDRQLKQIVELTLKCETEDQQNALIEALSIDLEINAAGVVDVNSTLNISKFKVDNGWFREDDNSVQLKNGKEYPIIYLSLSTTIYVPKNSILKLNGEGNLVSLGEHIGDMEVSLIGGSFNSKQAGKVSGKLEGVLATFEDLREGDLTLVNSELNVQNSQNLSLESSLSSISLGDAGQLQISNSINDRYIVEKIKTLTVEKSLFSNYDIMSCSESLDMNLKNSDIKIGDFESTLKYAMIKNEGAKVHVGLDSLNTFTLICEGVHNSEFSIPSEFKAKAIDDMRKEFTVGQKPELTSIQVDCKLCEVDFLKSM